MIVCPDPAIIQAPLYVVPFACREASRKKNGIEISVDNNAAAPSVIIAGNNLANDLDTAGGTPFGMLMYSFFHFDNAQNNSENRSPATRAPISPFAPRNSIPPRTVSVPARKAARVTSPAITGVSLPLDCAMK